MANADPLVAQVEDFSGSMRVCSELIRTMMAQRPGATAQTVQNRDLILIADTLDGNAKLMVELAKTVTLAHDAAKALKNLSIRQAALIGEFLQKRNCDT